MAQAAAAISVVYNDLKKHGDDSLVFISISILGAGAVLAAMGEMEK